MSEIILIFRVIIGILFLSTAISKILDFKKHVIIVKEYEIIPHKLAKFFSIFEVILEFSCAILLLLGLFPIIAGLGLFILLVLYTMGIVINLLRKRTTISCGCGGIAGNHHLSWFLVLRNIVLLTVVSFLLKNQTDLLSLNAILIHPEDTTLIFNSNAVLSVLISIFFFSLSLP
ncbi:DoxX family membrane protein [Bacillus sp. A17A.1]